MMMPANFSAISENEMTYVNGGASLADILAPELKIENWQKFNQNMVTIIGNSFMSKYIGNTVGVLTTLATMLASASMRMRLPAISS